MNRRMFLKGLVGGAAVAVTWAPLSALASAGPAAHGRLELPHPTLGWIAIDTRGGVVESPAWRLEGLNGPQPGAVTPDGAIWLCLVGDHQLARIDARGQLERFGAYGSALGQLSYPRGLALGADGALYVADGLNHRVQVFDLRGRPLRAFGALNGARDLAFDGAGRLYVTDAGARRVRVFNGAREIGQLEAVEGLSPAGIDVDARGRIYVANAARPEIYVFSPRGGRIDRLRVAGLPGGLRCGRAGLEQVQVRV